MTTDRGTPFDAARTFLLAHAAATFVMFGIIWFVQLVHYPLYAEVGPEAFRAYQARNLPLTTAVVALPMLLELATGVALVWRRRAGVPRWMPLAGLGLILLAWVSTVAVEMPVHRALAEGFDEALVLRLVSDNWVRTAIWSLRVGLVVGIVRRGWRG